MTVYYTVVPNHAVYYNSIDYSTTVLYLFVVFCESVLEYGFELVYNAIIIGLFNFIKIHCFNSTLRCKKMIRSIVTHPLLLLFLFAFLFNHAADVAHMSPT